ncbi:beta-ketoacyl synthase N-terminal-like domain-containing protein [Kitasatospora sp. NPDC028055]|uniref:type I polyketide synthase n=1 Tax=Kitasatospora sp. NPDC028055 TaxID=3155653 RepID=UPI0033DDDCF1
MDTEAELAEGAVAVVGMACRYPGAEDVRSYWAALRSGTEGITRFDPAALVAAGADPELVRRPDYVPARGVLPASRGFDWSFFGYSRAEAATIDPQHRIFLECASQAVDDAGIDPTRFPGWIGVFAGAEGSTLPPRDDVDPMAQVIGGRPDFLTSRVAYRLGLRGPAITVQTACSTSLVAVHLAVQSLLAYECDAALAGGVSLAPHGEFGYLYQEGGILSPDGHCRPFDEESAGTVPGEGVGVVVLKRLEDALRDGDRIAGLVLGSALNNDGGDKIGYTAPSIPGQREAILLAQKVAGIDPADLDYVEAHGTGTRIGDPVELQALTDAFRRSTDAVGQCWVGAVKSNLGHTGSASGVAGMIKTLLMMEHGEVVPTLHYRRPNPLLRLAETPFRIADRLQPWPERGDKLAAVSSFGVGGTNAHVVLGGSPQRSRPAARAGHRLLAVSGASSDGRDRLGQALADRLESDAAAAGDGTGSVALAEAARTLAGRRRHDWRRAVVADSPQEAARLLREAPATRAPATLDRVAFLFPGQGTLTGAAGAAAYRLLPGFRASFDEWSTVVRETCGLDLSPVVTPEQAPADWFVDTVHQQLGLLALGHALGRQLADWGITPTAMLGNSIGEYVAATLAEVWTPAEAARLVHARATAMRDTEPGRMAAVTASPEEVTRRIGTGGAVTLAVAGPERVVVSGPAAAVDELLAGDALAGLDVRVLDVGRAFHSATMEPASRALREAVAAVPGREPRLGLVSNTTGDWADPSAVRTPDYWAEQLRRTVRLDDGLATVLAADCDTFLELGPGTSMTGALRRHRDWDAARTAVPLLGRSGGDGERELLLAVGALWERGADLDPEELLGADRPFRTSLPAHPFDSRDPATEPERPARARARTTVVAGPVHQVLERLWRTALGVASAAEGDDFFTLGGESLMLVSLMSEVRRHTGAAVPVADFTATPTFGALVKLVEQHATETAPTPPGLVTLRSGVGRPLFLAADAMGSSGSYGTLASLVDTTRPILGLEPDGADRPVGSTGRFGRFGRPVTIEAVAARNVALLRQAQPSGPYTLGGWSFGAVVAHETARQLTRAGAEVDVLFCLDGFAPDRRGLPIATDPGFLAGNLRLQLDAVLGTGTVGGRLRRLPALRRQFVANIGAVLRYRPRPVGCPAVVLKAAADERTAAVLRRDLRQLYTSVEVHPVRGDHWSVLAEPDARPVAAHLATILAGTTAATGGE